MKHCSIIFLLIICLCSTSFSSHKEKDIVYICTGHYAQCYHSDSICKGLNTCNGDIIAIPLDKASKNYRPCKICVHKKSKVKPKKQNNNSHRPREPLNEPVYH